MLKHLGLLLALLVVSAAPSLAQSTPAPATITFQGRIAKPDGTPVPDTTSSLPYVLRISLWDAPTGGTKKWEVLTTVSTKNGVFSTPLEFGANAETALGGNRWIEMKIGNDLPLLPRQQLFPVAYALSANTVPNAAITSAKLADAAVLNAKLADFAITASKIQDLAIITAKLADLAVTAAKLASNAVTRQKIANDAVDNTKLANDSASLSKVSGGGLTISGGNLVVTGGLQVGANVDVQGSVRINGIGSGLRFPDGSLQTSASGIPAGGMILGEIPTPPQGFTFTGEILSTAPKWYAHRPLPYQLLNRAYLIVDGKTYVMGVTNQSPFLPVLACYDPATDSWTQKTAPQYAHELGAFAAVNGKIYAISGNTSNGIIQMVEEYNPVSNQWTRKRDIPAPRSNPSVAVANGKIHVVGGDSIFGTTMQHDVYDTVTDTWEGKASAPNFVSGATTAITNDRIYFSDSPLYYTLASDSWGSYPSPPIQINPFSLVSIEGRMGCIFYNTNAVIGIETYNDSTNKWDADIFDVIASPAPFSDYVQSSDSIHFFLGTSRYTELRLPKKYYVHRKN